MDLLSSFGKAAWLLVALPFGLCAGFLMVLGRLLGLSYKQISVYFNLYFQGALLALSGLLPLVGAIIRFGHCPDFTNGLAIAVFLVYASINVAGFVWLVRHYSGDTEEVFDRCVSDLHVISRYWHLSYHLVNLIIFIAWWLDLLSTNIILLLMLL